MNWSSGLGGHRIGRLTWQIEVDGVDPALALQSRLEDLSERVFAPIIDRVLSACLPADRHAVLRSLRVDLGQVALEDFERAAAAALERGLAEALAQALSGLSSTAKAGEGEAEAIMNTAVARLERLCHYLRHGTVPLAGVGAGGGFVPQLELADAVAAQPAELADLLRRLGAERQVSQRLILQADAATLAQILNALEPAHAGLIIAYMADLVQVHRDRRLVALGDDAVERMLWLISLRFVLEEAGSGFNRRVYLETLLRQLAAGNGLQYRALLALLHQGLARVAKRLSLSASLPAVLAELVAEAGLDDPAAPPPPLPASAPVWDIAQILAENPSLVLTRLRRLAGDRLALRRLIETVPDQSLGALLDVLDRQYAPLIRDYLADVIEAHGTLPLVPLGPEALHRLLWVLTLVLLGREPGSHFNRKSFLQALLQELAAHEGVDFSVLLETLRRGLVRLGRRADPAGALLGVLDALMRDLAPTAEADKMAAAAAYLRRGSGPGPAPSLLLGRLAVSEPIALAALLRDLAADAVSWPAIAARLLECLTPEQVLALLLPDDRGRAEAVVRRLAGLRPADEKAAWVSLLRRLAVGEALDVDGLDGSGGGVTQRFDRMAALSHLLRQGRLPWWAMLADPPFRQDAAVAALAGMDDSGLRQMFAEADPALRTEMAWRLVALVGGDGVRALLGRLAPWATARGGVLSHVPRERHDAVLARLLVAVAEGGSIELGEILSQAGAVPAPWARNSLNDLPAALSQWSLDDLLAALADPALITDEQRLDAVLDALAAAHAAAASLALAALPAELRARLARRLPSPDQAALLRAAVLAFLAGQDSGRFAEAVVIEAAIALADAGDDDFAQQIAALLHQPRLRALWTARLPARLLIRLVRLSEPRQARVLIDAVELLGAAWRQMAPPDYAHDPGRPWAALLDYLADHPRQERAPQALVGKVMAALSGGDQGLAGQVLGRARDLARSIGHAWLPALFQPPPPPPVRPSGAGKTPRRKERGLFSSDSGSGAEPEGSFHHIGNAGLVLAGPFLPRLFQSLDVLGEDAAGKSEMRDVHTASRAVHLLQWLVDERTDRAEPELLLNKILCGLDPAVAIEAALDPAAEDLAVCGQLLAAVLANWSAVSRSSVAALRETFLQREGRLEKRETGWSLMVQRKTVDVLVDQVPWGFSTIFHPWQPQPLTTSW